MATMNPDIRKAWLDYYQSAGYTKITSAPLVHPAFPISFNMSAGLVQVAPIVMQKEKVAPQKYCLVQKCVRYFDIKNVGDSIHLSFFEMPGAFEINNFEEVAVIEKLRAFLTENLEIPNERLWITSFNQDTYQSVTVTQEEKTKEYLTKQFNGRLVYGDMQSNFWIHTADDFTHHASLCGPRIEFFYDLCPDNANSARNPLKNPECFLEIGGIIFIKYFIEPNNPTLQHLPNIASESVVGMERVLSVTEKHPNSVFQTSLFTGLREKLTSLNSSIAENDVQILLDHIKALAFIFADEVIEPNSSGGRGKIVRTLIRTMLMILYVNSLEPKLFFRTFIGEIIALYEDFYPEIRIAESNLYPTLDEQIDIYNETLVKGKRSIEVYKRNRQISEVSETDLDFFKQNYGIDPRVYPILMR